MGETVGKLVKFICISLALFALADSTFASYDAISYFQLLEIAEKSEDFTAQELSTLHELQTLSFPTGVLQAVLIPHDSATDSLCPRPYHKRNLFLVGLVTQAAAASLPSEPNAEEISRDLEGIATPPTAMLVEFRDPDKRLGIAEIVSKLQALRHEIIEKSSEIIALGSSEVLSLRSLLYLYSINPPLPDNSLSRLVHSTDPHHPNLTFISEHARLIVIHFANNYSYVYTFLSCDLRSLPAAHSFATEFREGLRNALSELRRSTIEVPLWLDIQSADLALLAQRIRQELTISFIQDRTRETFVVAAGVRTIQPSDTGAQLIIEVPTRGLESEKIQLSFLSGGDRIKFRDGSSTLEISLLQTGHEDNGETGSASFAESLSSSSIHTFDVNLTRMPSMPTSLTVAHRLMRQGWDAREARRLAALYQEDPRSFFDQLTPASLSHVLKVSPREVDLLRSRLADLSERLWEIRRSILTLSGRPRIRLVTAPLGWPFSRSRRKMKQHSEYITVFFRQTIHPEVMEEPYRDQSFGTGGIQIQARAP